MTIANLLGALEGPELLIILALVLLLFGGKKLPELARSLGHAKKEFQDGAGSPTDATDVPANDAAVEETVTVPKSELDRLRKVAHERSE